MNASGIPLPASLLDLSWTGSYGKLREYNPPYNGITVASSQSLALAVQLQQSEPPLL